MLASLCAMGNPQPSPNLGVLVPSRDAVHRLDVGGSSLKGVAKT